MTGATSDTASSRLARTLCGDWQSQWAAETISGFADLQNMAPAAFPGSRP